MDLLTKIKINNSIKISDSTRKSLNLVVAKLKRLEIEEFVNERLYLPATYLLQSPGKLARPGLVFACAKALRRNPEEYVDLAAAIELIHTSSLIHDDIIDGDRIRRGKRSVHVEYGIEKAILAGNALISKGIMLVSKYGRTVIDKSADAAMKMCAGEMLDYEMQASGNPLDTEAYIRIAELKTGALIAASASLVAYEIGHPGKERLYNFGMNAGIAVQMRDDIMNYAGLTDKSLKTTRSDMDNSRPNIVSVLSANGSDELEAAVRLCESYRAKAVESLYGIEDIDTIELLGFLEFLKVRI